MDPEKKHPLLPVRVLSCVTVNCCVVLASITINISVPSITHMHLLKCWLRLFGICLDATLLLGHLIRDFSVHAEQLKITLRLTSLTVRDFGVIFRVFFAHTWPFLAREGSGLEKREWYAKDGPI